MEYYGYEHGFLEELLAMRSDPWEATTNSVPMAMNDFCNVNGWNQLADYWAENSLFNSESSNCFEGYSNSNLPVDQSIINGSFNELYTSFRDKLSPPPELTTDNSSYKLDLDTPPFPSPEDLSIMDDDDQGLLENCFQNLETRGPCKSEPTQSADPPVNFSMGTTFCPERRNKSKKLNGQPSKNLMAERRRRKRLNDRLSMLRSVVPKISKMDRTSILGDTIDYMKELLERINGLQEEMEVGSNQPSLMSIFKDSKPNELLVRNSPKFDAERRNSDTRIEICCAGKPGLLLSTLTTLEALGLEIQQCVISCFNDFSVQASCSEELEQREILSTEDIKQALFRNAGYGGRCL